MYRRTTFQFQYTVIKSLESVSRFTVWLHKGPGITPCFFQLGLIGSGMGLMIFHRMSPKTHHNYL